MLFPDLAYAAAAPPGGGGGAQSMLPTIVMVGAMLAIFYFLLIRPQQKQKQDRERMLSALKKGDRVVTSGGMHGTVTQLSEHTVTLRIDNQVKVEFDRGAVGRIVAGQGEKDV